MKQSAEAISLAMVVYKAKIRKSQQTIDALKKDLQKLQEMCPHNHMISQERAWAPGHVVEGEVCEICEIWKPKKLDFETVITTTISPGNETFNIDMSKKIE